MIKFKNELYCDLMIKWWPNSKIIYICRDPRDVYASYKIRDINNSRKATKVDALVYTWGNLLGMQYALQMDI